MRSIETLYTISHEELEVLYLSHRRCNKPVQRRFLLDVDGGGQTLWVQVLYSESEKATWTCPLRPIDFIVNRLQSSQILTFFLDSSLRRLLSFSTQSSIEKQHTPLPNFKQDLPITRWSLLFAENQSEIDNHGPSFLS